MWIKYKDKIEFYQLVKTVITLSSLVKIINFTIYLCVSHNSRTIGGGRLDRRREQDLSIRRTRQWQHTILNSSSMFPTLKHHITNAEIQWELNHSLLWLCVCVFQDIFMHISDSEKRLFSIFSSLKIWFQQCFDGIAYSYLKRREDSGWLFCIVLYFFLDDGAK